MANSDSKKESKEENFTGKEDNEEQVQEYPETDTSEFFVPKDNPSFKEDNKVNGANDVEEKKKENTKNPTKKSGGKKESSTNHSRVAHIFTASITTIAVALVGVGVVIGGNYFKKDPKVTADVSISSAHLYYKVDVTNVDKVPLKVKITGLTKSYTKEIDVTTSGSYSSQINDLKGNTGYSFKVVGDSGFGDKTYFVKEFTTDDYVPILSFQGISWDCQCTVDGYAYYSLAYEDDYGYWSKFHIYLSNANESHDWAVADPTPGKTSKVDVKDWGGGEYNLQVHVTSTDPADQKNGTSSIDKLVYPAEGATFTVKI
ncbi:MAG: hypothetical protein LKJ88_08405 [Bacilli bacterium]|jgi:hypothetical protein|nr:hypothetical protein [Bacilli bacterium]